MTTLSIFSESEFKRALEAGKFKTATVVRLDNLTGITAKPRIAARGSICRNGRVWR